MDYLLHQEQTSSSGNVHNGFVSEAGLEPIHPRVIVVEDNEDDAAITMRGLGKVYPTLLVDLIVDGASAITRLTDREAERPELVFLDLKLPKVNGLDVLAAIRSAGATKELPVVVFTSSDEPRDVSRARELGCIAYLTKPIDWDEYIRLVCQTAAGLIPGARCLP